MQGFYFLIKFGLALIYILKVYLLRFYWEKICSIHYLDFSFEKHVTSQVLKDFSVEILETTPGTFLSKFSSEIYLSWIVNYWGSIFTLYLMWVALSLVCVLSVFFLSFFFYWYFCWQTLTSHGIERKGKRIVIFLIFHFHQLIIIYLVHRDFYHLFLINRSICNNQIDSSWDLFS